MKKTKIISTLLSFALLLQIFQPFSALAYEYEYIDVDIIQDTLEEGGELTEEEFDELISILEEHISFEDGEIIVDEDISELSDIFGKYAIEYMVEGIEYLNELADEEELVITENGTIYETSDDEFFVQGGVNRRTWHWWGTRTFMSTSVATSRANTWGRSAAAFTLLHSVANAVGFLPKTSVASGLAAGYFALLSSSVHSRNSGHRRGIVLNMTWIFVFSTARQ